MIVAPAATLLGTVLGTALGLVTGYYRGAVDDILSRVIDAFLAHPRGHPRPCSSITALGPSNLTLIIVIGLVFAPIIARTVRAAVLQEREMEYVAAARLRNEKTPLRPVRRDPPERHGPDDRRVHRAPGLRHLHGRDAQLPRLRHPAAGARLGPAGRPSTTGSSAAATGGRCCSRRWRSPSSSSAVNLIADGIAKAFER